MLQIILKERTTHLTSYTFFTKDVDYYRNMSLSQLYQPPRRLFFPRTRIASYFRLVNIANFLRSAFLYTSRSSRLQMFFKIGVLKNCANFTGKHLCWSLFLKNSCSLKACNFIIKRLQHRCFTVRFTKFLKTHSFTEHLR